MNDGKRWFSWLLASVIACFSGACKETDAEPQQIAEERRILSLLTTGFNAMLSQPRRAVENYLALVPLEGPVRGSQIALTLGDFTADLEAAESAFRTAERFAPPESKKLVEQAVACRQTLVELMQVLVSARGYYDDSQYETDHYELGKRLHREFNDQHKLYAECIQRVGSSLDQLEVAHAHTELRHYEKTKGEGFHFRRFQLTAKQLILTQSPEAYQAALAALQNAHAELTAFSAFHPPSEPFKQFEQEAGAFQHLAKTSGATGSESSFVISSDVVDGYNALVQTSNRLRRSGM